MMKKLAIITTVLLSAFLMSCSVQEDEIELPNEYKASVVNVEYTELDYEILELINAHRISKDLRVLTILNEASKEAITHNQYMVNQGAASHDYFYVRSQNLKDAVNAVTVSENVGYGLTSC